MSNTNNCVGCGGRIHTPGLLSKELCLSCFREQDPLHQPASKGAAQRAIDAFATLGASAAKARVTIGNLYSGQGGTLDIDAFKAAIRALPPQGVPKAISQNIPKDISQMAEEVSRGEEARALLKRLDGCAKDHAPILYDKEEEECPLCAVMSKEPSIDYEAQAATLKEALRGCTCGQRIILEEL